MKAKTVTGSLLVLAAVVFAPLLRAQDMVKVAPKNCSVVLDNDRVRVIRVVLKPGETLPMHSHPANVVFLHCTQACM
jgi:quercetin dioxygenase-like cupin family protein